MPINKSNYFDRFEKLKLQIGKDFDQLNFIHPSVKCVSLDVDAPVYDGMRYIVGDPDPSNPTNSNYGTGTFSSCPKNYIAEYDSRLNSWTFFKPYAGMEVIDRSSRYLKRYNSSAWVDVMNFSVVSEGVNGNAALADEAVKLSSGRTFKVSGAVVGSNTSDLTSGVTIPTTLVLSENSSISGILPIEKGGTGNTSGLASGLDHSLSIVLSGGVQSSLDWANVGPNNEDFSPNLKSNTRDSNNYPYAKYTINVDSIDADYIRINELSKLHGGTGRTDGLVPGLDHNVAFSLSGGVIGNLSSNLSGDSAIINTRLQLGSNYIDGVLSKPHGGTGNSSGYAAGLDHKSKFNITGKVTGESRTTYQFIDQDPTHSGNDKSPSPIDINISKINLGSNDSTNITGTLSTSNGGTGNNTGNAPTASKLKNSRTFSIGGIGYNGTVSFDGSSNVSIPFKLSLPENGLADNTKITGILPVPNGGTGNAEGKAPSAVKLSKYFKIDLKHGSTNLASTNYFNGETSTLTLPSNSQSQTLILNLQNTTLPMSIHPNPESSGTGPYSRVYIDSKGHVRSGTYSKKTSFKTISYSFDIFKSNNFIYKFTQNSTGIQHFGNNPGYMSFYTKPFTVFNDSNIYKDTTINISVNVIFNGLFYWPSGNAAREWIHYLDILLFNEPENYDNFYNNIVNTGNLVNDYYLNLITGNNNSATSSTFLNNCYHLIGKENGTFAECGINLYDRLQNYYVNIYGNEMPVSFYSSVFNYSKSIKLTNFISSGTDFSKAVYGIFKISTRCDNSLLTYNKNIERVVPNDSTVSYYPYYTAGRDYMSIDRPSHLKLTSPRIDFEYDSY